MEDIRVFEKKARRESREWKNYRDYISGKSSLENIILPHPDGDDVLDFVKSEVKRSFWLSDPKRLKNTGKLIKK